MQFASGNGCNLHPLTDVISAPPPLARVLEITSFTFHQTPNRRTSLSDSLPRSSLSSGGIGFETSGLNTNLFRRTDEQVLQVNPVADVEKTSYVERSNAYH